jgi:hypothetical protein
MGKYIRLRVEAELHRLAEAAQQTHSEREPVLTGAPPVPATMTAEDVDITIRQLKAVADGKVDYCKARAAFPACISDAKYRRLCRYSRALRMEGKAYPFLCWQQRIGKKLYWFVDKAQVDCFLISQGIKPVDFDKSIFAPSEPPGHHA